MQPGAVEQLMERIDLGQGAGVPVHDEAVAGVLLGEALGDELVDVVVGHQVPGSHVMFDEDPEVALRGDGLTQHVPRAYLDDSEVLYEPLGLRPLAGARGTQKDETQKTVLLFWIEVAVYRRDRRVREAPQLQAMEFTRAETNHCI